MKPGHHPRILALLGLLLLVPQGVGIAHEQAYGESTTLSSTSSSAARAPQVLSPDGRNIRNAAIDSAEMPDLYWPNFASKQKEVKEFYTVFHGALPWIAEGKPTSQAREIIQALKSAEDKGLRPDDYDGPKWDARLAQFERATKVPEPELVKFDLALTVATMRYVSDLHIGRVNPRLYHVNLDIGRQQFDLSDFLTEKLVPATNVAAVLETVEPPFPIYRRTESALKKYRKLARLADNEPLPLPPHAVKPGDTYAGAPQLAKFLALVGDLPEKHEQTDTNGRYQGALVDAVRNFQERHGLRSSGILDAPTIKKMNIPLSRRVTQLELAMERMRWLPHQFKRPPIVVNIPEFRLYVVNDEYRTIFTMNVVVGKAYGHQTPVFANEIQSVIFRPYWNVPQSIVDAELIPHLEKNPSYLAKNSYEIVDTNERVVSEGVVSEDIEAQLRSGNLRIRQTPGPENALGLVKFEFPNEYGIYMHGTPVQQLFSRSRRDFSHGCIRVEDPVKLANWVLRDIPDWTDERIRAAMNGDQPVAVQLKNPIPVLILYSTAVILEGGEERFFDDIYGLDAVLERALAQGLPYSRTSTKPNTR